VGYSWNGKISIYYFSILQWSQRYCFGVWLHESSILW